MSEKKLILNSFDIKEEFMKTQVVGGEPFNIKYTDKGVMFDHYFSEIKWRISDWIETLASDKQKLASLLKQPNYAFIHHIAQNEYPLDYSNDACVMIVSQERFNHLDSEVEQFDFHNTYADIVLEVIGVNLDEDATVAIDTSEMLKEFAARPICEYGEILSEWEDTFLTELGLIADAVVIAVSRTAFKQIGGLPTSMLCDRT